jgi:hypothetical protein
MGWMVRLWVQYLLGVCITYPKKKKKKLNNPTMCATGVQEKVSRLDSPVWILLNTYLFFFFTIQMSDMRCMNHMLP